jgi:hypothetical protein
MISILRGVSGVIRVIGVVWVVWVVGVSGVIGLSNSNFERITQCNFLPTFCKNWGC